MAPVKYWPVVPQKRRCAIAEGLIAHLPCSRGTSFCYTNSRVSGTKAAQTDANICSMGRTAATIADLGAGDGNRTRVASLED